MNKDFVTESEIVKACSENLSEAGSKDHEFQASNDTLLLSEGNASDSSS